ncbi:hypothetical protein SAMN05444337_0085 [Flavobacterium haoranii]|uniref:Uncharacterized protein n=1 Tax=Flavobacterium haoranii TaxID=683124 RepID=A0A1M6BF36_9FLAO|nr:hypothetical protein SAMN05444337_0085 [Flavobacterium haoranii]
MKSILNKIFGLKLKIHVFIVLVLVIFISFLLFNLYLSEFHEEYFNIGLILGLLVIIHCVLLITSSIYFFFKKESLNAIYRIIMLVFNLIFLYVSIGIFMLFFTVFS